MTTPISDKAVVQIAVEAKTNIKKDQYYDKKNGWKPLPGYQVALRTFASKWLPLCYSPENECKYRTLIALQEHIKNMPADTLTGERREVLNNLRDMNLNGLSEDTIAHVYDGILKNIGKVEKAENAENEKLQQTIRDTIKPLNYEEQLSTLTTLNNALIVINDPNKQPIVDPKSVPTAIEKFITALKDTQKLPETQINSLENLLKNSTQKANFLRATISTFTTEIRKNLEKEKISQPKERVQGPTNEMRELLHTIEPKAKLQFLINLNNSLKTLSDQINLSRQRGVDIPRAFSDVRLYCSLYLEQQIPTYDREMFNSFLSQAMRPQNDETVTKLMTSVAVLIHETEKQIKKP